MFFGRERFKFVLVGAGSSVFTMRLTGDILAEPSIRGGEIALVDIDPFALSRAERGVRALVAHAGKPIAITAHPDVKAALPEADFVILTYAIGGYAAWKRDIEISTRFGAYQSVGDTIGPGGIIRILRTIPFTMEIAHEMERVCPDAYIINYANPEGAQCLAIQKYSKIRSFGLCHGTPDTARELAGKVFRVDPDRLAYEAAGVNHLTWFTRLRIDGKDVYPGLRAALRDSGYDKKEPISADLLDIFGLYPAPGDRHVSEFFSAFLRDRVMKERDYEWKNNDFIAVDAWRAEGERKLDAALAGGPELAEFMSGSGETAARFIRSLATGEVTLEMVNVINEGFIDNLSRDIIVELPTFVDQFGLHPQHVGALPAGIAAKCEALGREYNLAVAAAVRRDRQLARQAMYLDPIAANTDDPDGLLNALIEANLDLLPEGWS